MNEDSNKDKKKYQEAADRLKQSATPLPGINFSTFIFSLNSSALLLLGLVEDPVSGAKTKNLPAAKQTIDIIGMLAEKTRGNLTQDEGQLVTNILHDLRLMYVRESKI
jgi:hypothetical protein